MIRSASSQIVQSLVSALRSGGSGRWLALAIIVGVVAIGWWRPEILSVSPVGPHSSQSGDHAASTSNRTDEVVVSSESNSPTAASSGQLSETGPDVFRSAAGLVYTRGSQQGHRLRHVMAHAQDQPNRAGQHGVFADSDQDRVVALIDEAYLKSLRGESTRTRRDQQRTILTVDMRRTIGYVGGQTGNRQHRPPARFLRLVLEDNRVITAYPVVR